MHVTGLALGQRSDTPKKILKESELKECEINNTNWKYMVKVLNTFPANLIVNIFMIIQLIYVAIKYE